MGWPLQGKWYQSADIPVHLLERFIIQSVMSDSWWPHELQHARLPCSSPSPWVCSNLCPLSQWCHPTILSSTTPFFCPQSFPASVFFSNKLALHISWSKYWSFSFSISPSNEYSGLNSFRMDCFYLAVQGTLECFTFLHLAQGRRPKK